MEFYIFIILSHFNTIFFQIEFKFQYIFGIHATHNFMKF